MSPTPSLRLSVLDQAPVRPGATARQALQEAHLGARAQHIRLGSDGVLLPHYSTLKVTETVEIA